MGRRKTISDDDVLTIARQIFREQGHTATTRAIADAAGISEAILYQRFGSKDHLFFKAMHATGPDLEELLGPADPPEDAHAYLRTVAVRLRRYFSEVIPLALRVMTHPSFDFGTLRGTQPMPAATLRDGLAARLDALVRRQRIAAPSTALTAKLLVSLAHDSALAAAMMPGNAATGERDLRAMVDILWQGLRRH